MSRWPKALAALEQSLRDAQLLPEPLVVCDIGAKVVRHGRYVTFQLAEVAIPRALFAEILHLIDGLRPASLPL